MYLFLRAIDVVVDTLLLSQRFSVDRHSRRAASLIGQGADPYRHRPKHLEPHQLGIKYEKVLGTLLAANDDRNTDNAATHIRNAKSALGKRPTWHTGTTGTSTTATATRVVVDCNWRCVGRRGRRHHVELVEQ